MRILLGLCVLLSVTSLLADEPPAKGDLEKQLDAATKRATDETYEFRYKFQPKEAVRWKVTHLATTETKIQGNTQTSQSRSVSFKLWKILNVDASGNTTFEHSVSSVEMWQKVTGRPEVRYNSETDKEPPPEYAAVAKTVGVPLATLTIDPQGKIVTRDGKPAQTSFGLGDIALPLPTGRVKVGHEWTTPGEIQVRQASGEIQRIKTRLVYTLESVKTDVATIAVKTQVLTPVNDPKIKSQLMQQLTQGTVKFDLDAGRILHRQMDWNEQALGFNGANSNMQYLARFTEELQTDRVAKVEKPADGEK